MSYSTPRRDYDRRAIAWTDSMIAVLHEPGSDRVKARTLRLSEDSIRKKRNAIGLFAKPSRPPAVTDRDRAAIRTAWPTSETAGDLAARLGFSMSTIRTHAQRMELGPRGTVTAQPIGGWVVPPRPRACLACDVQFQPAYKGLFQCLPCRSRNLHDGLNW